MAPKISPLAGKPALKRSLVPKSQMLRKYNNSQGLDPSKSGTSGHRGKVGTGFTRSHMEAIAQTLVIIKNVNGSFGPKQESDKAKQVSKLNGPILVVRDERYLSEFAAQSVIETLAANGKTVITQKTGRSVPTPIASHRIIRGNIGGQNIEGVIITASHNPMDEGGIKTNGMDGGPNTETKLIDETANHIMKHPWIVEKLPANSKAKQSILNERVLEEDLLIPYITDLENVVDMEAIRDAGAIFGATSLGGSAHGIYSMINALYGTQIREFHSEADPMGSVRTYDWDGKLRGDPSSKYVMKAIKGLREKFGLKAVFANDNDGDRFGLEDSTGLINPNHALCVMFNYLCENRGFDPAMGIGRTIGTTHMLDLIAATHNRPAYEMNVGFKHYVKGLKEGAYVLAGEESAGLSLPRFNGKTWVTEKDGIVANLLMMEIMAKTGKDIGTLYGELVSRYGAHQYERIDSPATTAKKARLASLIANKEETEKLLQGKRIAGRTIERVKIGDGIKVVLKGGIWVLFRASGTENIIKVYREERGTSLANAVKATNEIRRILGL